MPTAIRTPDWTRQTRRGLSLGVYLEWTDYVLKRDFVSLGINCELCGDPRSFGALQGQFLLDLSSSADIGVEN
jgi:hypothetical protein